MFEEIKKSSYRVKWQLREIHKITQWKDGCVWKTKSLGMISCSPEYATWLLSTDKNLFIGSVSTKVSNVIHR